MSELSLNLLQAVEKSKSITLLKKYYKKTITPQEKATLLLNLQFTEARLVAVGKSIFECRNNLLKRFPVLQQKSRDELVQIISSATTGNNTGKLAAERRFAKSCWDIYRAAIMDCFILFGNDPDNYDACMSLALDMYHACGSPS